MEDVLAIIGGIVFFCYALYLEIKEKQKSILNLILCFALIFVFLFMLIATVVCAAELPAIARVNECVPEPQDGVYFIRDTELQAEWTEVYRDGKEVIIVEVNDG